MLSGARRDVRHLLGRRLPGGPLDVATNTFQETSNLGIAEITELVIFRGSAAFDGTVFLNLYSFGRC